MESRHSAAGDSRPGVRGVHFDGREDRLPRRRLSMTRLVDALALEDIVGTYRKDPRLERKEKFEARTAANFRRPVTVEERSDSESTSSSMPPLEPIEGFELVEPCNCGLPFTDERLLPVRAGEDHPRCSHCNLPVRSDGRRSPVLGVVLPHEVRNDCVEAEVGERALVEDNFHGGSILRRRWREVEVWSELYWRR